MKKIFFSIILFFSIAQLFAQDATFTATVSKNKVSINERFQLTLTLNNGGNLKDYKAPSMNDFMILGGPNQSSSFSSYNGQVSQSTSYSYVLQPRNMGKFIIGSASAKADGKTLTTQPITMEVVDQPVTNQNNQNQNNQNSNNDDASQDINAYLKNNVFIKSQVSDYEIYKGEDIAVTLKLYVNKNSSIYGYKILQAVQTPKYDGFYVNDIQLNDQQATVETINGQQYTVSIIKKTILTAQKSGTLEIDPITLDAIFGVQVKRQKKNSGDPFQDMWDDFFSDPFNAGNKEVRYSISSTPVKIKVNDLPANAPADFGGAVGKFTMQTAINNQSTKTDEPLTYRINISGNGNLNLFNEPQLNLPPGWETYQPKTINGNNSKTFEYLIIPRSPGEFTIPSYSWSYFDPDKKQYVTLNSQSFKVNVEPGAGYSPTTNNYGANKEDVEILAKDIRFIKKETPVFINSDKHFFGSGLYYTGLGLPFVLGIGLFIFTVRRKKLEGDVATMKNRRANAVAKRRLLGAAKFVKENNVKGFYDETIKTMWNYLSDKLNIAQSELSKENIHDYLLKKNIPEISASELIKFLADCEMALFAPQLVSGSLDEKYKQAVAIIEKMEGELKR